MGTHAPSSLSWRVSSDEATAKRDEDQQRKAEDTKHHRNRPTPASNSRSTSSIAMGMLPAISIAVPGAAASSDDLKQSSSSNGRQEGSHHHHFPHSTNPFAIGPLRQDDRVEDSSSSKKAKPKRRHRTKEKLSRAGRSLSPFRHHGRSSAFGKIPAAISGSWSQLYGGTSSFGSKLLTPRSYGSNASSGDVSEREDDDNLDTESDADSIASGRMMQPRNTAFERGGKHDGEELDDEDVDRQRSTDDGEHEDHMFLDHDDEEDEEEEEEDDPGARDPLLDFDDATIDNTLFNAGCLDLHNAWQHNKESIGEGGWYPADDDPSWGDPNGTIIEEPEAEGDDQAKGIRTAPVDGSMPLSPTTDPHARLPNVILPSFKKPPQPERKGSKYVVAGNGPNAYSLVASRPEFARNRCTVTLVHGEYEKAVKERALGGGRGPKKWIVASDGSEESSYAIEWTIGTVLRDGDETLIVSVMETSEKIDPVHKTESSHAKAAIREHQEIRQNQAIVLARQATALLQRTRLAVKVGCQALHAKHSRHMLLDLIDFYQPTMVIVGSRGLGSLKGILLGSTSHYLVQKSSCPVMVARKRLQLPALPRGKGDVVSSVRRRHMRLDEAAIEKKSKIGEESDTDTDNDGEERNKGRSGAEKGAVSGDDDDADEEGDDSVQAKEKANIERAKQRQEGEKAVAAKEMSRSFHSAYEPSPEDALRDLNRLLIGDRAGQQLEQDNTLEPKLGETIFHEPEEIKEGEEDDEEEEEEEEEDRSRATTTEHPSAEDSERGRSRSRQGR